MKSSLVHALSCAVLLAIVTSPLGGCGKIKSLVARKPGQPSPTPANAVASANASGPAADPVRTAVPTPAAAITPARPLTPAINKSAAVIVLCYHRLEEKPRPKDSLAITPAEFEKEMQTIKNSGFTVIPMQDFLAWRRGDKDIPIKSAVITIDDGFVSGYDTAWPILKKFGYPFTMFVYVNYIASGGKSISWDQLAEMRDAGVDIGSHTYSHGNLRNPNDRLAVDKHTFDMIQNDIKSLGPDGWLKKEIVDSKLTLEKQLGIKVSTLAYPFGKYDQKVRDLVKQAGYDAAFTVYGQPIRHSTPAFDQIGRYAVEQNNPKVFLDAMTMIGGGAGGAPVAASDVSQLASASMITQPMEGETISNPKPIIKANLAAMGDVDPKSVDMRVSGIGLVPAKYDAATKTVSFQVAQPLQDKNYTVILTAVVGGKRAETRWSFNYDPKAAAAPKPR